MEQGERTPGVYCMYVLHVKRGSIKSQITLFEKVLASSENNLTIKKIKNLSERLNKVELLFDSFNEVQSEIECLTYETQETYNQEINERESATSLRELINTLQNHLNCLRSLGQPVDSWNALLISIVIGKLDNVTINQWETKLNNELKLEDEANKNDKCSFNITIVRFSEVNKANETIPMNIPRQIVNENTITDTSNQTNSTTSLSSSTLNAETLLSTAMVKVNDTEHNSHQIRVLLHSASQSNFVSEGLCDKLKLRKTPIAMNVIGIGQGTINISHKVMLTFYSCCNNYKGTISCLVVPQISSALPTHTFNRNAIEIPPNIKLADPIRCRYILVSVSIGQVKINQLILQKSKLGWLMSGELVNQRFINDQTRASFLSLNELGHKLERFWQVDEFTSNDHILTNDEEYCEDYFRKTTTRDEAGKFIVKIPFKPSVQNELGNSGDVALARLKNLERRFETNPVLKENYIKFMQEYQRLNHMSKIENNNDNAFYLPHHAIIRESSETTKLRVVFDGLCKLEAGLSINEAQFTGPILQNDIFSIIARFRLHQYVFIADVENQTDHPIHGLGASRT
ncbi:hypothetical protein ILUMI_25956 [Ignelater luminosus]|uniref:Peptidase aspartic putative domain-containing protein n=1 Tax=Ignelater luminosus TaxID=2038154 RepID=A0A8K0C491_IGNLU|nr:hypothetical protein ILUMI_25956 [Ignelater luminosus]